MAEDRKETAAQEPGAPGQPRESQQVEDIQDLDVSESDSQSILGGAAGPGRDEASRNLCPALCREVAGTPDGSGKYQVSAEHRFP